MSDELQKMRDAWAATARYSVFRDENRKQTRIAQGLTLAEARELQDKETAAIKAAPGYRPVMSRPMILIELEKVSA